MERKAPSVPGFATQSASEALQTHEGLIRWAARVGARQLEPRLRAIHEQDLLQEARLALCSALRVYDPSRGSLPSFAVSCMRVRVVDAARRLRRHAVATRPLSTDLEADETGAEGAITSLDPDQQERVHANVAEDAVYAGQVAEPVRRFLAGLPARDRVLAEAIYWRGESQAAVAEQRHVSRAAVNRALQRVLAAGREQLRELLAA